MSARQQTSRSQANRQAVLLFKGTARAVRNPPEPSGPGETPRLSPPSRVSDRARSRREMTADDALPSPAQVNAILRSILTISKQELLTDRFSPTWRERIDERADRAARYLMTHHDALTVAAGQPGTTTPEQESLLGLRAEQEWLLARLLRPLVHPPPCRGAPIPFDELTRLRLSRKLARLELTRNSAWLHLDRLGRDLPSGDAELKRRWLALRGKLSEQDLQQQQRAALQTLSRQLPTGWDPPSGCTAITDLDGWDDEEMDSPPGRASPFQIFIQVLQMVPGARRQLAAT